MPFATAFFSKLPASMPASGIADIAPRVAQVPTFSEIPGILLSNLPPLSAKLNALVAPATPAPAAPKGNASAANTGRAIAANEPVAFPEPRASPSGDVK